MSKEEFFISRDSKPLIVQKKSKWEVDLEKYKDIEKYKKICILQNNIYEKIYESHLRQVSSREIIQKEIFPNGIAIFREQIESYNSLDFEFIVSLGGDNHFTYVSHHALNSKILGCNSDPVTSVGALLGFDIPSLKEVVLSNGKVKIENWSLIQTTITYPNGKIVETFPAVSEISIRNNSPDLISRYIIEFKGFREEQKSSGLLVYTGAGSTGWVASCYPKKYGTFSKEEKYFHVYAREPRRKHKTFEHFDLLDFRVYDSFEVISEMDGGISIDSLTERTYRFPPGAKAKFQISSETLQVIVPL